MKVLTSQAVMDMLPLLDPNGSNPTVDGHGVYTGTTGNHCLAGEILARSGFDLPPPHSVLNTKDVRTVVRVTFPWASVTDDALAILQDLQVLSDTGMSWGEAIALVVSSR